MSDKTMLDVLDYWSPGYPAVTANMRPIYERLALLVERWRNGSHRAVETACAYIVGISTSFRERWHMSRLAPCEQSSFDHRITVDGSTVCRDGRAVKVVAFTKSRDLQIGCTYVTRAALLRLVELSTNSDVGDQKVMQEGA